MRYFTNVYEFWHLPETIKFQVYGFDHERAADWFSEALMLPKSTLRDVWEKLGNLYESKSAIIYLVDMAKVYGNSSIAYLI